MRLFCSPEIRRESPCAIRLSPSDAEQKNIEHGSGNDPKRQREGEKHRHNGDNGADPKLIATLDNIRSLDRNPLIHPEDWLSKDDAIGVFNTAQTAFDRLVSDMEKRKLLPSLKRDADAKN